MQSLVQPIISSQSGTHRSPSSRQFSSGPIPAQPLPEDGWVLVVDDDRLAGRSTSRYIRQTTGLGVSLARTIHQAECLARFGPTPAAIVTDFELQSNETGVLLLERLLPALDVPALILTGAPELAASALAESTLSCSIPVLSRGRGKAELLDWLVPERSGWACPTDNKLRALS